MTSRLSGAHGFSNRRAGWAGGLLTLFVAANLLADCTTAQEVRRPDGTVEYQIACGAATGWNICYQRANELCPGGYETVSKEPGFNRKEMLIRCPNK